MREFVIAQERLIEQHNRDAALAWRVGNFVGFRKLPPLKDFLIDLHPPTLDQQVEAVMGNMAVMTGRDPKRVRMERVEGGGCRLISLN